MCVCVSVFVVPRVRVACAGEASRVRRGAMPPQDFRRVENGSRRMANLDLNGIVRAPLRGFGGLSYILVSPDSSHFF